MTRYATRRIVDRLLLPFLIFLSSPLGDFLVIWSGYYESEMSAGVARLYHSRTAVTQQLLCSLIKLLQESPHSDARSNEYKSPFNWSEPSPAWLVFRNFEIYTYAVVT